MKYTIQDKISQMLLVGIPNRECIPGILNLIKNYHIGGVILYKNNYNNLKEMVELINDLKKANEKYDIPLFIAIDQEGGRVNRLPNEFHNIKSLYRLAESGKEAVEKASFLTSNILSKLGINMNFSPVLDIRSQKDDNAFIGNRAFSKDVDEITEFGFSYVENHLKNKVIPVIKHFPGHGNINVDSHVLLPVIHGFSKKRIDLKPFQTLMKEKAPAVMVGHILLPNYTGISPATLSRKFVDDFIRKEEKYEGLVITDELGMKGIRIFYGKYLSIKKAFLARNDIISCKYRSSYIEKCLKMLTNYVDINDLDYHFDKIIRYKKEYNINDNLVIDNLNVDLINEEIEAINKM